MALETYAIAGEKRDTVHNVRTDSLVPGEMLIIANTLVEPRIFFVRCLDDGTGVVASVPATESVNENNESRLTFALKEDGVYPDDAHIHASLAKGDQYTFPFKDHGEKRLDTMIVRHVGTVASQDCVASN